MTILIIPIISLNCLWNHPTIRCHLPEDIMNDKSLLRGGGKWSWRCARKTKKKRIMSRKNATKQLKRKGDNPTHRPTTPQTKSEFVELKSFLELKAVLHENLCIGYSSVNKCKEQIERNKSQTTSNCQGCPRPMVCTKVERC